VSLPFDAVFLRNGTSAQGEALSVEAFLALPLPTRLRAIFEQRVEFFRNGERVEVQEALRALRTS
jgi:hypothetical protein